MREFSKEKRAFIYKEVLFFKENSEHESFRIHPLKRKLQGQYSLTIAPDLRIIFKYRNKNLVVFQNIGDHSIYQ